MHTQNQHRRAWEFLFELFERVDAITIGHGHIEQKNVPGLLPRKDDCVSAIFGFTGDYEVVRLGQN